jgi:hypothetical protein
MTVDDPSPGQEGYWSALSEDDVDLEQRATARVRELLVDRLEPEAIHGISVTRRQGETVYLVVAQSTTWDQIAEVDHAIPILDLRTVVVDLEDDSVSVSDNGLWIPQEADVAESITRLLGRAVTDLSNGEQISDPTLQSAVDGLDPEMLLDRELEIDQAAESGQYVNQMDNHGGIDPSRAWGYGAGPPPEIDDVVDRLEEIDLNPAEHTTRLQFGKKEPWDRQPVTVEKLQGNYGIELLPRSRGLIAIDVDYPEEFPDSELPETLEISSPHGSDERRHILLSCENKDEIAERLGAWAIQGVEWGDLWIGDRYVVGPGSQLSEFGCDDGDHERGERGGCSECSDPSGGYYEIVSDHAIATVDPDDILDLIDDSDGYELRDRPVDPDPPEPDEDDLEDDEDSEPVDPRPSCDSCGRKRDEDALKEFSVAGETRRICRGGCDS